MQVIRKYENIDGIGVDALIQSSRFGHIILPPDEDVDVTLAVELLQSGQLVLYLGSEETFAAWLIDEGTRSESRMDDDIVHPGDLHGRFLRANEIKLTWDGNKICALVGRNLVEGVAGFGDSVYEALRDLANSLVQEGIWIEVSDRTEWDIRKITGD